jgi:hypothetical protein
VVLGTFLGIELILSGTSDFVTGIAVRKILEPRSGPAGGRPATRFQH